MRYLARDAFPEAVAESINTVARAAHSMSERNIKHDFTLRNSYTLRGLVYYKASPRSNIDRIDAVTGHRAEYMARQDEGFRVRARRRRIPIPTTAARTGKSRSRPVSRKYWMPRLGTIGGGGKFFIGRPGAGKKLGIYERMARGRLRMIRDLSVSSYTVKATGWHTSAVKKYGTASMMGAAWVRSAKRRIARVGAN